MEVGIHILNFVSATISADATRNRPCISALLQYNSYSWIIHIITDFSEAVNGLNIKIQKSERQNKSHKKDFYRM